MHLPGYRSLPALRRYQDRSTLPLLVNGFVFLAAFVALTVDPQEWSLWLFWSTWAVFLLDYLVLLYLAPVKWRFVTRHLVFIVALIVPILRVVILILLANRVFLRADSKLRGRVGLGAIYVVAITLVFGSLFVLMAERGAAGANIKTYGEALWWAVISITTVGYGDYTPVSVVGRIIGVGMIAIGVGAIGILTATIVGVFSDSESSATRKSKAATPATSSGDDSVSSTGGSAPIAAEPGTAITAEQASEVLGLLHDIRSRLTALEQTNGQPPDRPPDSDTRGA